MYEDSRIFCDSSIWFCRRGDRGHELFGGHGLVVDCALLLKSAMVVDTEKVQVTRPCAEPRDEIIGDCTLTPRSLCPVNFVFSSPSRNAGNFRSSTDSVYSCF